MLKTSKFFVSLLIVSVLGACSTSTKPKKDTTKDTSLVGTQTLKQEGNKPTVDVVQEKEGLKVTFSDVLFSFNKTQLKPGAFPTLDKVVDLLHENPTAVVHVDGFTDNVGSVKANNKISTGRAFSVADYLEKKGIEKSRITYTGKGASNPVAPNNSKVNRQKNRRVEILISTPSQAKIVDANNSANKDKAK